MRKRSCSNQSIILSQHSQHTIREIKEAIRQAAVTGIIRNPEGWLKVLAVRNDTIHDNFTN